LASAEASFGGDQRMRVVTEEVVALIDETVT